MIYLDYAKSMENGYILNFFADSVSDLEQLSNGKKFVTKNGTDYGAPLPSSTVVITMPDKTRKTYVLGEDGEWVEGGAGGGALSVQADYNQNDSTQPDYIKNRPFYEETKGGELTEVFNETLFFEKLDGSEIYLAGEQIEDSQPLDGVNPGDTISVTFNGTEYSLVVEIFKGDEITGIQFGNSSLIPNSSGKDTGEPFVALYANTGNGSGLQFLTTIQSTPIPVIIKVGNATTVIKTIDPKFIKDMYHSEEIEETLYDGIVTTTESTDPFSSEKSATNLPYGATITIGKTFNIYNSGVIELTLAEETYLLFYSPFKAYQKDSTRYYGIGDYFNGTYAFRVAFVTESAVTTTNTLMVRSATALTNATLKLIKNSERVTAVPAKYIQSLLITTSNIGFVDDDLKSFLNSNKETGLALLAVDSFVWEAKSEAAETLYLRAYYVRQNDYVLSNRTATFYSITVSEFFPDTSTPSPVITTLKITLDSDNVFDVKLSTRILLTNNSEFFINQDTTAQAANGDLVLAAHNAGSADYSYLKTIRLDTWITVAQEQSDFQIPVPTKETDLVDKKYADSLVSGGSSLSIELAVGASENTADVFKTYLNNNASVLTQLEAASSFTLKVVKTTSVTTLTLTYTFAKNYTNTFTGAQYHFVCVYGTGETTVEGTVLWFSVSDSAVSDLKLTTYDFARITYNHCISITDGSTYSLKFIFPSKSATLVTTQAQLTTLIGNSELPASGWALVDSVYYTIGFIKNNSYCYYGNAKEPTWHSLGEYTITDTLL